MKTPLLLLLVLAVSLGRLGAVPSPAPDSLAELFMPPQLSRPKLSPDGANIAFLARRDDVDAVAIYNFASRRMVFVGGDSKVRALDFWWKEPQRLLVKASSYKLEGIEYTAFDADGKHATDVWRLARHAGQVIEGLPDDPHHVLMVSGGGVVRVNIENEHEERISGELQNTAYWILDRNGTPRAGIMPEGQFGHTQIWWRASAGGEWRNRIFTADERQFYPSGVAEDERYLFGWEFTPDSEIAISRQDTTTGKIEPLSPIPGLDPTGLVVLGRTRQPIAIAYEQGSAVKLVALSDAVTPGIERMEQHFLGYHARIAESLPDGKNWLLWVGNSCLPGAYILFNHETSEAVVLAFSHNKTLSEDRLAPADYFTFPRRDGGRLSARIWRPHNHVRPPLIVYCPEGLPAQIVRDSYQPEVQAFVQQGFAVLRVNVRNSWGFGKAGRQLSEANWTSALQENLDDAVHELVGKKIVDGARVFLFGQKFGGVLALQVALRSRTFAAVATVNPPSEVHRADLAQFTAELGGNTMVARLGGWSASEKTAQELSPTLVAPLLPVPALYLSDEDSIAGHPDDDGRRIRSAVKQAKAPVETGLAFSWSRFPKPHSKLAAEHAAISSKIATFFAGQKSSDGVTSPPESPR